MTGPRRRSHIARNAAIAWSYAGYLDPEKVAYWYFRLNGFFQIENFVVHPARRGGQRIDADLLAVRFPYRAERMFDDPNDIMADDERRLALSRDRIDVIIGEVKTNQPCALNGPWIQEDCQNVHRVLAAIGCLLPDQIEQAAADIYRAGVHVNKLRLRIRLIAVGGERSEELSATYPDVVQLTWPEMLAFIWERRETHLIHSSIFQFSLTLNLGQEWGSAMARLTVDSNLSKSGQLSAISIVRSTQPGSRLT
jgi:hypothetical protein